MHLSHFQSICVAGATCSLMLLAMNPSAEPKMGKAQFSESSATGELSAVESIAQAWQADPERSARPDRRRGAGSR